MDKKRTKTEYVVCVKNEGYPASLELRKLYRVLNDPAAKKRDLLRIIDESGEDYLYPDAYFRRIAIPSAVQKALQAS
jgi:hypothetical protein